MSRFKRKQRNWLGVVLLILSPACANQEWRHGNYTSDPKIADKRQDERDRHFDRADEFRVGTPKHYIKEYKKHDGKINLFKRDGFDWGF